MSSRPQQQSQGTPPSHWAHHTTGGHQRRQQPNVDGHHSDSAGKLREELSRQYRRAKSKPRTMAQRPDSGKAPAPEEQQLMSPIKTQRRQPSSKATSDKFSPKASPKPGLQGRWEQGNEGGTAASAPAKSFQEQEQQQQQRPQAPETRQRPNHGRVLYQPPSRVPGSRAPNEAYVPTPETPPHEVRTVGRTPATETPPSGSRRTPQRKNHFEPYLPRDLVERGLATGDFVKGKIRINPKNFEDCYVTSSSGKFQRDINIPTLSARNRALEGDGVAVEVLPRYCWRIMETEAERAGIAVPSNHLETLAEALEQTPIGSPKKLKRIVSKSEMTRPTLDLDASDRTVKASVPPKQRLPQPEGEAQEDSNDDMDKLEEKMALLNAYDQQQACAKKAGGDDENEEDDGENTADVLAKVDPANMPDPSAPIERRASGPPFLGPIEMRNGGIPEKFLQPVGKVVHILSRDEGQKFVGRLEENRNTRYMLFVPRDMRVPRMLVPTERGPQDFYNDPKRYEDECFTVRLRRWNEKSILALGEVVDCLGPAGAIDVETESILQGNLIDTSEFGEDVLACLPPIGKGEEWEIPEAELEMRRDLRNTRIFSIDPITARDLDDALSCTVLDDGCYEIGVHIADVSHFMEAGTALDEVAQRRATSTYMVQGVYPMLPRLLCENLCSLVADRDRLAFSVIWKLDPEGHRLDQWIGRTVIRSCGQLAYEHAQAVIENPDMEWTAEDFPGISSPHRPVDVKNDILHLNRLAKTIRKRRYDAGALSLNKGKIGFRIDNDTLEPLEIFPYKQRDSNRLIEEFMLLANMSVAEFISDKFPHCALLRRHPPPLDARLQMTKEELASCGIDLGDIDDDKTSAAEIHRALQRHAGSGADPADVVSLAAILARSMQLAEYFCTGNEMLTREEWRHYALNASVYTHFTSPIRRYADVVVHRLVAAALSDQEPDYSAEAMDSVADNCNDRKLAAKRAQEASSLLFMSVYVSRHGPFFTEGVVIGVMSFSVKLYIPEFTIEHQTYVNKLDLDTFVYDEPNGRLLLKWPETDKHESQLQMLDLFTHVRVRLSANFKKQKYSYSVRILHPEE